MTTAPPVGPQPAHRDSAAEDYVWGIDILRFLAAAMVMAFHLSWRVPGYSALAPFGWVGVQIFFVVSGLVIANSAYGSTPVRFLESRLARLYPAAVACAVIGFSVILALNFSHEAVSVHATGTTQAFFNSLLLLNGPFLGTAYWTLPVELAFYGLVLGLLVLNRFKPGLWLAAGLVAWSGPLLVVFTAHTLGLIDAPWSDLHYGPRNALLLRHGMYFGMGVCLWRYRQRGMDWPTALVLAAGGLLAGLEIFTRAVEVAPKFAAAMDPNVLTIQAMAVWLAAMAAVGLALRYNALFPRNVVLRSIVRVAGLVTYPVYLMHEAVGGSVMGWLVLRGYPVPMALAAGAVSALALAWLVVQFWEPPARAVLRQGLRWSFARLPGRKPA